MKENPSTGSFQNEPLTDFSRAESREAMRQAIAMVQKQVGGSYPPVVGGKSLATTSWIDSVNPSHKDAIVGRCGRSTPAQAEEAVRVAMHAFPSWRATDVSVRCRLLHQVAEEMRQRKYELAAWQVLECAKQWREADADVAEAIDFCDYYAHEMKTLASPRLRNVPGEDNAYLFEPRGVVVVIAPWNFPLAILCGMTVAALVSGNTVIMKPAEQSSVTAALLMELFQKAGFPEGVVNYLPGLGEEIGPVLVKHPDVSLIAFTGSLKVGQLIQEQAAVRSQGQHHFKRVIAELGGKNAIIVDDDADMDEAVRGVMDSAFGYQGQKCSACSRAIILKNKYEEFLQRLVEAAKSLTIGPAEDPTYYLGPVIDEEAHERLQQVIARGRQEAPLVFSGDVGSWKDKGYYLGPHIFAPVSPRSFLAQEEFFGPILAVLPAKDMEEALKIALGVPYALTGGLYSRSPSHIERIKRDYRVGNLYINRKITGALVDRQPFGGFKLSGIGSKAGGPDYLLQFLLPRTITENTLRRGFAPGMS